MGRDGEARAGLLRTPHGAVETPAFMPVGTKGTVKGLTPGDLRTAGAGIVLGNTYHLYLRPGADLVREAGGLQAFTGWDGPMPVRGRVAAPVAGCERDRRARGG